MESFLKVSIYPILTDSRRHKCSLRPSRILRSLTSSFILSYLPAEVSALQYLLLRAISFDELYHLIRTPSLESVRPTCARATLDPLTDFKTSY